MARKAEEPTTRCHIHIFERDKERLEDMYGTTLGFSKAVRTIIRRFLAQADAKAAASAKSLSSEIPALENDLSEETT